MNLPKITDLDVSNKKVIVRADLDIEIEDIEQDLRVQSLIPTLDYLNDKKASIIIIAHRGRPDGKFDESLSLKPFQPYFDKWGATVEENLRFDPGEESNDPEFTRKVANLGDLYVNEAFASSHREHSSIVGLPKLLPHAVGLRFQSEVDNLSKVFEDPARPLLFIISGLKQDKLDYVKSFETLADKILIGGRLPEFLGDSALESVRTQNGKTIVGNLVMDKEDVTLNTIEKFEREIEKARTIVLSGPLGRFEDAGHRQGTEKIYKAVAASNAFKVTGGGDTEDAIRLFNLEDKFDWVSVGGGAMLDFISLKTLPGIEALKDE